MKEYRMGSRFGVAICLMLVLAAVGCDKAKGAYQACVAAEGRGELREALTQCRTAILRDPSSASGKAAEEKADMLEKQMAAAAAAAAAARAQKDAEAHAKALEEAAQREAEQAKQDEATARATKSFCSMHEQDFKRLSAMAASSRMIWREFVAAPKLGSKEFAAEVLELKARAQRESDAALAYVQLIKLRGMLPGEKPLRDEYVEKFYEIANCFGAYARHLTTGEMSDTLISVGVLVQDFPAEVTALEQKQAAACRSSLANHQESSR